MRNVDDRHAESGQRTDGADGRASLTCLREKSRQGFEFEIEIEIEFYSAV